MELILVIDDDTKLCGLLSEYLGDEGMQVEAAHTGEVGLEKACQGPYDLVVLDVMLPVKNGFDVLSSLRKRSSTPVIMLTARGSDVDRIVGLEMGADDYLSKPFNPRELVARIRSVLRRAGRERNNDASLLSPLPKLQVGDVELNPGTRQVMRMGEPIDITSVEFSMLEILLRRAGTLVYRDELAEAALGRQLAPYDRSVDVHVSKLRRKLGSTSSGMERIRSIRSAGYLYILSEDQDAANGD